MREKLTTFSFDFTVETIFFNDRWELELENYLSDYLQSNNIWGNPIKIGNNQFHVYGVSKTTWKAIWIDLKHDNMMVMFWD
jgi:hypothetical protein